MLNLIPVTDFFAPELDIYARLNEVQLLHYYEPDRGIFIAESPKVIGRALDAGYEPISFLIEEKQLTGEAQAVLTRCGEIPIYVADSKVFRQLTGFPMTRGVLTAMRRSPLPSIFEILSGAKRIAILENVMNPTNVGAIFRSAAALSMDAVLLTSGCSDPLYRRAARVSMGTVFQIPWTIISEETIKEELLASVQIADTTIGETPVWPDKGISYLHSLGFKLAAMALKDDSLSIEDPILFNEEKLALILGTEGDGLMEETIALSNYTVRIPMSHGVDSLNVAAASAVAFWQLRSR